MNTNEAIKAAMKSKGVTQMELAERLSTGQSSVAMYLKRDAGMKVENLIRMANASGFDLVLADRDDPRNAYVIGETDTIDFGTGDSSSDVIRGMIAEEVRKALEARGE